MSDLIDRAQAQTELQFAARRYTVAHEANGEGKVVWSDNLISVTDAIDALRKVPSAQLGTDCISRQAAIDICNSAIDLWHGQLGEGALVAVKEKIEGVPSAQLESCEYYALCRHGRDERKLRASLGICEYCNEDSDGYVKPIEKNNHAFVRFGMDGWELDLKANGWHGSAKIRYCPMCGRELKHG